MGNAFLLHLTAISQQTKKLHLIQKRIKTDGHHLSRLVFCCNIKSWMLYLLYCVFIVNWRNTSDDPWLKCLFAITKLRNHEGSSVLFYYISDASVYPPPIYLKSMCGLTDSPSYSRFKSLPLPGLAFVDPHDKWTSKNFPYLFPFLSTIPSYAYPIMCLYRLGVTLQGH